MSLASRWIGAEGAAFERVGLAFQALGYTPPTPDPASGSGAYAMNIAAQYAANLSTEQAMDVIAYGLMTTRESLQVDLSMAGTPYRLRLSSIRGYADQYAARPASPRKAAHVR